MQGPHRRSVVVLAHSQVVLASRALALLLLCCATLIAAAPATASLRAVAADTPSATASRACKPQRHIDLFKQTRRARRHARAKRVCLPRGNNVVSGPPPQLGGSYPNARIAEVGLQRLGQHGGQCKEAVNIWVAIASGGAQRLGGDYLENYRREGGSEVSRDQTAEGDIIQLNGPDGRYYYEGMHTAVIVSHATGSDVFEVVDSNSRWDEIVREHAWNPYVTAAAHGLSVHIWRMGSVGSPESAPTGTGETRAPAPTEHKPAPRSEPPPSSSPPSSSPPPTTYAETTGGVTHTWTNYTNAGGNQGPSIPANATVQISCKLTGFRVEDGNTWWYRIASPPWSGNYYASADAFYNNGQTSGSLLGTPFVDPAVANC